MQDKRRTLNTSKLRRWWLAIVLAMVLGTATGIYILALRTPTWTQVNLWLDWRFANVDSLSTAQLGALLDPAQSLRIAAPLLLDVRSAPEFAASRLPGARPVTGELVLDFAERELAQLDRSHPIVVYCSVGVRSAIAAQDLQLAGFTQVKNLRGSIFAWANEGRALEGGQRVHPYNAYWGRLLRADLHAQSQP